MEYEQRHQSRKRKRRKKDEVKFREALTAITCDLAYDHLMGWPKRIAITRSSSKLSKATRYRPWYFGEHVPDILDYLTELNLITQVLGFKGSETTIKATEELVDLMGSHRLQSHDIGFNGTILERVVLKYPKEGHWRRPKLQDYKDTAYTNALRQDVDDINQWIATADIGLLRPLEKPLKRPIHLSRTTLVRVFNCSGWCYGGRLYGGWWQSIRKDDRRGNLTINGELAVELDFGQMNPYLMYAMLGIQPPEGDLYELDGLKEYRDNVKIIWNTRLNQDTPMTRYPRRKPDEEPLRVSEALPVHKVLEAIDNAHPALVPLFDVDNDEPPIGFTLMNQESNILIKVLQELRTLNVVALPIHDAVLVPASKADVAEEVMIDVFRHSTGLTPSITRK